MAYRVSYDATIRNGSLSYGIGEPFLFAIPHGGRNLLLAIVDMLKYKATYSDRDTISDEEWDILTAIVDQTINGLMAMEQINIINATLEEIRDALLVIAGKETAVSAIDNLGDVLSLLDPRLAVLVSVLNGIENVLGGTIEP